MKPMTERTYTVLCPFGGMGGGALGFLRAEVRLLGVTARFRCLGSIDADEAACADFEMLTGSPAWCRDVQYLTAVELRERFPVAPDVVFGSPPCLPSDGLVIGATGPRRIDSIRAGDLVLTHKGRLRRVLKVGTHNYEGKMYGFRLNGTVDTQWFTSEHPLWIRRMRKPVIDGKQRKRIGPARFVSSEELRVGDRVGFPIDAEVLGAARRFIASLGDPQLSIRGGEGSGRYAKRRHVAKFARRVSDLSEHAESSALWFLIGAYLGDGYRRRERHEVAFCVGPADGDLAARVREALASCGLHSVFEDRYGGDTNVKLRIPAKHLSMIMGAFGDGAENKYIPEDLWGLERPLLDALIDGYRATDGSDAPRSVKRGKLASARWKIVSVSLPLLRGIQRLLLRRSQFGAIHRAWPGGPQTIMGRSVQTRPRWEIKVTDATRRGTYDFIGDAVWVRIREKSERATRERVWNLEVDEDNTFCAPMMATHNCKGSSGLLSGKKAKSAKYQRMNKLAVRWVELMLEAWPTPPKLFLLENVPRIKSRAAGMLRKLRALLRRAGYVLSDGYHDCGELGGLAQVRRRYLLVARHASRVPTLLYQPPTKRVRGCGEVLGELPLPEDPAGGPMHRLPRLSWLNWVRLALIPAGGDWRDLEGVLRDGQSKREVFRRHHVQRWGEPSGTVAGSGSNGPSAVADPRCGQQKNAQNIPKLCIGADPATKLKESSGKPQGAKTAERDQFGASLGSHWNKMRVEAWGRPAHTVTGSDRVGSGAPSVADPRFKGSLGVTDWSEPAATVTGESYPSNGTNSVADPRVPIVPEGEPFDHAYGVLRFNEPSPTVAGGSSVGQGAYAVADERYRGTYGVLSWVDPAGTVTGNARPPTGRFTVADPRLDCAPRAGAYGVIDWRDAAATITGSARVDNGRFAVADPRKPPPFTPLIIAADGTWHRPLTTLELAALQGLPTLVNGEPLKLHGSSSGAWRERIGNAVPPPAAQAIAERMLVALIEADLGAFALSGSLPVWVEPMRLQ